MFSALLEGAGSKDFGKEGDRDGAWSMECMGWLDEQELLVVVGEGDMVQGWVVFDEWVGNICWLGWILVMAGVIVEG